MNITYQSVNFKPENITKRYVKISSNDKCKFYDVDKVHKTIREYWMMLFDVEKGERNFIIKNRKKAEAPYSMLKICRGK